MYPLLSIVVPSKDRYETLLVLIDAVMSWPEEEFELIIQDNSTNNDPISTALAEHADDPRFLYNHVDQPLSAPENGDVGMSLATGRYVTLLGDDDGLLPQTVDICRWLLREKVDVLACQRAAYVWPDVTVKYRHNETLKGSLRFQAYSGKLRSLSATAERDKVSLLGASSMENLPRLYHGLVRRDCLESLKADAGTYFPGPVMDMSSSVGLVPFVQRYVSVDIPLIISGNSAKSMAGKNLMKQHQGNLRSQKALPADTFELWTKAIPRYWSGPTIWAETFIKACERTGQQGALDSFSNAHVYAGCIAFSDARYYREVWLALKGLGSWDATRTAARGFWLLGALSTRRARLAFSKKRNDDGETISKDCADIAEVIELLRDEVATSGTLDSYLVATG